MRFPSTALGAVGLLLAACASSPELAEHAAPGALLAEDRTVYLADFSNL